MATWLAVTAALGSAGCAATANALQHRSAVRVGAGHDGWSAIRATVTQGLWLGSFAFQGFGFLLHAVALHFGQLTLVQPLFVSTVLFALPLNRVLRREPVVGRELWWALLLVIGLAGFLTVSTPQAPSPAASVDIVVAAAFAVIGVVIVVACLVVAQIRPSRSSSLAALGVAAGLLFAAQAAMLKASVVLFGRGIGALLTSWQPYVLVVVGICAVVVTQVAYRRGPLSSSLPVTATVDPLLGVVIGVFVYDESVRESAPALAAEVVFLILLSVSTLVLARAEMDGRATAVSSTRT